MIRKPAADWRGGATPLSETLESAAAIARQGRDVVEIGAHAARTGVHVVQGLVLWGIALFWGAIALGMVPLGELPTAIGVGLMALAAGWGGKRAFARAGLAPIGRDAPGKVANTGAREIRYSRPALLVALGASLGAAWLAGHVLPDTRGLSTLLVGICLIGGPVLTVLCGIKLVGNPQALLWDDRSVTVATLWKRRTVRWTEVSTVTLSTVTSYVWGVIPIGRSTTLGLKLYHGRGLGLTPGLLALDGRSAADLVEELDRYRSGRAATATVALARVAGVARRPVDAADHEAEFDPDAIIGRYLAEKARSMETPSLSPRSTFGRKIT